MEKDPPLSLQAVANDDSVRSDQYKALRSAHLSCQTRPMDDMWLAFADMGQQHLLCVQDDVVGCCSLGDDQALIAFYVEPRNHHRAPALLRLVLGQLQVGQMMVSTSDAGFLSVALDVASSVEPHTLLYALEAEPGPQRVDSLRIAESADLESIVSFHVEAIGAPLEFLNWYVGERVQRAELLLVESDGQLQATGELRVDQHQPGIAHLGLIVNPAQRSKGLGSRLMGSLVERSRAAGHASYCSTEVSNIGAQRAIERAGFRSSHRLLRISYAL